jgi:hypothetical protein
MLHLLTKTCCCCCLPPALQDNLVPVPHVDAMVRYEVPSARIMHHPSMHHADFLFSPSWQDLILSHVAEVGCVLQGLALCCCC